MSTGPITRLEAAACAGALLLTLLVSYARPWGFAQDPAQCRPASAHPQDVVYRHAPACADFGGEALA